jgi:hypothetical protein
MEQKLKNRRSLCSGNIDEVSDCMFRFPITPLPYEEIALPHFLTYPHKWGGGVAMGKIFLQIFRPCPQTSKSVISLSLAFPYSTGLKIKIFLIFV